MIETTYTEKHIAALQFAKTVRTRSLMLNFLIVVALTVPAAFAADSDSSLSAEPTLINILPGSVTGKNGINLNASDAPAKVVWQALACELSDCKLYPAKLRIDVANQSGSAHVSNVRMRRSKPDEITVALIAGLPAPGKEIDTYFTTRSTRTQLDASSGSIGIAFNVPQVGLYRILPRWNNKTQDNFMTLYAEQDMQRQAVGRIPLQVLNSAFKTADILVWAGDIDGDGKLDLITRNTPDSYGFGSNDAGTTLSNGLHLWLSTRAEQGQLMGLAASVENWQEVSEEDE